MTHSFPEIIVGGVLVAPFLAYAVAALLIVLALRPVLHATGCDRLFSHPSIAGLSLYVTVVGLLTVLF